MRNLMIAMAMITCLSGCVTRTEYGSCKGVLTQQEEDPGLRYEVRTRNVVLAAIFVTSVVWPLATASFWLYCPEGKKSVK